MKRFTSVAGKIFLILSMALGYIHYFVLAQNNRFVFAPNWFSGDANYCGEDCQTLVAYPNYGFPVQINGAATSGPYWLAWLINITFAVVIIGTLTWLLFKRPRYGYIGYYILLVAIFILQRLNSY